mmetsp:Transcript_22999/g.35538  ORF Transcript_22999/g.35538 Transcript_22999/m.35538 type:complete len:154 (+) Transcript_22999:4087-4548(+)
MPLIRRVVLVYMLTVVGYTIYGIVEQYLEDNTDSRTMLYLGGLVVLNFIFYFVLPTVVSYLANMMGVFMLAVIFLNIIMSIDSSQLIPIIFFMVLIILASVSQLTVHLTIILILVAAFIDNVTIALQGTSGSSEETTSELSMLSYYYTSAKFT